MSKLAASVVVGPFAFTECSYDAEADVAYLSIGSPREAICWMSPEGHLIRLDPSTDELVGVTLLNLRECVQSAGEVMVTFPEHVLAAAEGSLSRVAHEPLTLSRAELEALCA